MVHARPLAATASSEGMNLPKALVAVEKLIGAERYRSWYVNPELIIRENRFP